MYLDSTQIQRILPQSYPFILIDRVVDFRKGESLTAIKNITGTEWVFQDWCYPKSSSKLFPETLLIEAAAQAAILFYRLNKDDNPRSRIFLGRAKAEFFRPVYVGDQLNLKTASYKMLEASGYVDIDARVNDVETARLEIMYNIVK